MSHSPTPPLFAQSCRDILERLKNREGTEAFRMRKNASELHDQFMSWNVKMPAPSDRAAAINRLFALYREVFDHVIKK